MLILLNTVGLTERMLQHTPRLAALPGWRRGLREVLPSVTCTTQASFLTGKTPQEHGIVGNGWLWRETGEVRFWLQSNRLIQAEPLYVTARRVAQQRGKPFRCAKLFWWFNQGAAVDWSITPKPHYGSDGDKRFDILGTPEGLAERLKQQLGPFPFPSFWGPMAGLPCSQWIGQAAADVVKVEKPELTLVYLPHLDYDTQRFGPDQCDLPRLVKELDDACAPILDAAKTVGASVWVVNETTHVPVKRAVQPNVLLRKLGMLTVRLGPFGELPDLYESKAFAVCDHQICHVYATDASVVPRLRDQLADLPGVAKVYVGEERAEIGLAHDRAGDLLLLSEPDAWFAYPFWNDERQAPDYAHTVNIHAKPGYDPCELFFDPKLWWPKGRAMRRLLQKKLGFRTLFDVVPLDLGLVKGSHGLQVPEQRPVMFGDGPAPPTDVAMTDVRNLVLKALDLYEPEA